ncbi:hypothetical protein BH09ACT1_BH09ACT1_04350 [soil metagenome]
MPAELAIPRVPQTIRIAQVLIAASILLDLIDLASSLVEPHDLVLKQLNQSFSQTTANSIVTVSVILSIVLTVLLDTAFVFAAVALSRGRRWGRTLLLAGGILSLVQLISPDAWTTFILLTLVSAISATFSRPSREFLRKRPIHRTDSAAPV